MAFNKRAPQNTLQFRREVKQLLQPRGLGVIFSQNQRKNINQIFKRLEQPIISNYVQDSAQNSFNERVNQGKISFEEFRETPYAQNLLNRYGENAGFDLVGVSYLDYLGEHRSLTKDEIQTRAASYQNAIREIKRQQRIPNTPASLPTQKRAISIEDILGTSLVGGFSPDIRASYERELFSRERRRK